MSVYIKDNQSKLVSIADNNIANFVMDIKLSDNITETEEGYLKCENVTMGRTGVQKYLGSEIRGFGFADNDIVEVYRDEKDVFHKDTLKSMEGKPVTLGHPNVEVTVHNIKELGKGYILGVPVRDGDNIVGNIMITDMETIELVKDKKMRELSLGYRTKLIKDEEVIKQTQIAINHLALVSDGRAGNAMIIDEQKIKESEEKPLDKELKDKAITVNINLGDEILSKLVRTETFEREDCEDETKIIKTTEKVEVLTEKIDKKDKLFDKNNEEIVKEEKEKETVMDKEKLLELLDSLTAEELKAVNLKKVEEKEEEKEVIEKDEKTVLNDNGETLFGKVKQVENTITKDEKQIVNDYAGVKGDDINKALNDYFKQFSKENLLNKCKDDKEEVRYIESLKNKRAENFVKEGI